ncbi:diphthamide biosynthesis protein [Metschnikowia bicuspidata var. bicuspidata NRRL YB-4993]|uniref:2-(3-amino-3-carboxypropyl)histidine synthase subunit 2 n=1 Tax=Metschnikowia bicuspidata var. bicuspidata NRRL YB-4993 TaxID=869754 RepID=A0A1A0HDY9_9ASCO|nr:diphthamide biosynthesis protein [Metschnikowia bicuspidata var. bicuspidata NRRL YB-4993]OBA22314.1 diphthamide biosynthesis protein [Metschnikowia bicuspidata var. bicuspidata NRRL YB-4993]
MATDEIQAPALSTPQDDSAFTYAKVNKAEIRRSHLQLAEGDDYVARIHEYYSLDELASFLCGTSPAENGEQGNKYKRVTLQFPDLLICDSATIVQELQKKLNSCCSDPMDSNQRLWILADTSYSACCIDEVAAQHVNSDLVVHFGDACLNPVASLSSAYVFGKPRLDLGHLASEFEARYPLSSFKDQKVVLLADAPHTYLLEALARRLSEYQIIVTDLNLSDEHSLIIGHQPQLCPASNLRALGRVFRGLDVEDNDDSVLSEYDLFHIGLPEAPRLLQLTTKFQSVTTFHENKVSQGPFPNLMRRYRYMHMARAAGTVGILVNTLSLANTKVLVNQLAKKIKEAGKKHYIFVVGKPNVAKLANFEAVDMWCVLGCDHQGIILDQTSEYFKPIVTPYELILAIGDEFSWTGKWVTDFRNVLSEIGEDDVPEAPQGESSQNSGLPEDQESDEEPEFNPVTGLYTSTARPLRRLQHLRVTMNEADDLQSGDSAGTPNGNPGALVQRPSGAVALRGTVSTSAAHLQTRQWTGLGSDWTEDADADGAAVEEGTSGIARGYAFDVENRNA